MIISPTLAMLSFMALLRKAPDQVKKSSCHAVIGGGPLVLKRGSLDVVAIIASLEGAFR
jgi:hypothetical protein